MILSLQLVFSGYTDGSKFRNIAHSKIRWGTFQSKCLASLDVPWLGLYKIHIITTNSLIPPTQALHELAQLNLLNNVLYLYLLTYLIPR